MKTKKSNSNIEVYENLYPFSLSVASINDIEEINNKYYFYNNISDYLNYSNKIENLNPDPSLSGLTVLVSDKETEHKSVLIILDLELADSSAAEKVDIPAKLEVIIAEPNIRAIHRFLFIVYFSFIKFNICKPK